MRFQIVFSRSNPVDPDPRVEKAARCLQGAGYRCMIWGWQRLLFEKCEQHPDLVIKRILFPGKFGGSFTNFFGLFVFNLWLFFNHLLIRPKIIHAFDLDTVLPALAARFFLKNKVVYDIADWYADSRKVGFLEPFIVKLERWVCTRADLVILAHEERLQQLGFQPKKWAVIYNTPDDIKVNESSNESSYNSNSNNSNNYDLESSFVYVGVLQPDRGIEQMIKAACIAKVKLVLAGFGPLAEFCKQASQLNDYVKYLGRVSYHQALTLEKQSIAVLALYDPRIKNNKLAAPNKLFESMMLGRPIITTKDTLAGRFVETERIGVTVPYGDVDALIEIFTLLKNNPSQCEEMGGRGRKLYEKYYSYQAQCEILRCLYDSLIN